MNSQRKWHNAFLIADFTYKYFSSHPYLLPYFSHIVSKDFLSAIFWPKKKIQFLFFFVKNILLSSLYRFHCAHDRARAIRKITESGKQLVSDNACVQASDLPKNCNLAFYLAGTAGGWKFDEEKVPWLPLGLKPFRTKATATTNVSQPKKKRQRKRSSHICKVALNYLLQL